MVRTWRSLYGDLWARRLAGTIAVAYRETGARVAAFYPDGTTRAFSSLAQPRSGLSWPHLTERLSPFALGLLASAGARPAADGRLDYTRMALASARRALLLMLNAHPGGDAAAYADVCSCYLVGGANEVLKFSMVDADPARAHTARDLRRRLTVIDPSDASWPAWGNWYFINVRRKKGCPAAPPPLGRASFLSTWIWRDGPPRCRGSTCPTDRYLTTCSARPLGPPLP